MKNKYKTLFSNTILFAIGNFGSKFILFFLVPLYTTVLSTDEYGITELILTGINLIIPFITLSINDSILRFGLDKNIDNGKVLKNSCLLLTFSTIIIIVFSPILGKVNEISNWNKYFIIIMILQMFRSSFSLYLKSVNKIKIYTIDSILYTFILASLNIFMLLILKQGLNGYFRAMIIAMIISLLFQIVCGKIYDDFIYSKIDIKLLKDMIIYSTPLIANAVSWWVINSSDRFMIDYFLDKGAVGLYAVAAKIPSLITSVSSVFIHAWVISSITEYDGSKDKKFYKRIFSNYSLILVLVASAFMLIIKNFMLIYVGNNFAESWKFVSYLLLGSVFYTYSTFFTAIYKSAKKNINEMIATTLSAILNIILNLLLIPYLGVMGAVIATMVTNLTIAIYVMFDSRRFFKFEINYKILSINFVILIIQCIIVSLDYYPVLTSIISIIILIIVNYKDINKLIKIVKKVVVKKFSREK